MYCTYGTCLFSLCATRCVKGTQCVQLYRLHTTNAINYHNYLTGLCSILKLEIQDLNKDKTGEKKLVDRKQTDGHSEGSGGGRIINPRELAHWGMFNREIPPNFYFTVRLQKHYVSQLQHRIDSTDTRVPLVYAVVLAKIYCTVIRVNNSPILDLSLLTA